MIVHSLLLHASLLGECEFNCLSCRRNSRASDRCADPLVHACGPLRDRAVLAHRLVISQHARAVCELRSHSPGPGSSVVGGFLHPCHFHLLCRLPIARVRGSAVRRCKGALDHRVAKPASDFPEGGDLGDQLALLRDQRVVVGQRMAILGNGGRKHRERAHPGLEWLGEHVRLGPHRMQPLHSLGGPGIGHCLDPGA